MDPIGVAETQRSLLITQGMSRPVLGVLPIDLGLGNMTGPFLLSPHLQSTSPSAKASHCTLGASLVVEPGDPLVWSSFSLQAQLPQGTWDLNSPTKN